MNNFRYLNIDTLMHRLNPAVKILWFVLAAVLVAVCQDFTVSLYMAFFFFVLWFATRLQKEIWGLFKSLAVYLFMILLVWVLILMFQKNGQAEPILEWRFICLEWADFARGFMTLIRIFLMISTFYLLIMTTNFSEIIAGLHTLLIPYKVAFSVGLVFQAIPIMVSEYETVLDAQRSRGLEIDKGSLFSKIKKYAVILLPLFMRVLSKSQNMTTAMFVYRLDLNGKRAPYKESHFSRADVIFSLLWLLVFAGCIFIFIKKPLVF